MVVSSTMRWEDGLNDTVFNKTVPGRSDGGQIKRQPEGTWSKIGCGCLRSAFVGWQVVEKGKSHRSDDRMLGRVYQYWVDISRSGREVTVQ